MKNALKIAGSVVAVVIALDVVGFVAWAMSGQHPVDGFYLGRITTEVLRALFF